MKHQFVKGSRSLFKAHNSCQAANASAEPLGFIPTEFDCWGAQDCSEKQNDNFGISSWVSHVEITPFSSWDTNQGSCQAQGKWESAIFLGAAVHPAQYLVNQFPSAELLISHGKDIFIWKKHTVNTDRALQHITFHKNPPTQSANKMRCYLKPGASWLYLILPSKVMKNAFLSSNLCSVIQQAFCLNQNLTTSRPFWADTPHRWSFITKFSQGFLNTRKYNQPRNPCDH